MSHFKDHASWLVCVKSGKLVGWFVGHIVKWGKESCLNFPPCTESSVFLSGEIWNGVEITICPPRLYCITVLLQSNDESPPLRLNGVSKLTLTVYSISKFVQRIVAFNRNELFYFIICLLTVSIYCCWLLYTSSLLLLKLARQKPLSKPQWLSHFQLCTGLLHEPTVQCMFVILTPPRQAHATVNRPVY